MGALTNVYVDPSIAGDSGTGTIGDPYGDLQYALNTMTRDATNGNQINIKAGTAEILAASLTLATYGTPTKVTPLVLRGYTSSAGDGGKGDIDCNENRMWAATDYQAIYMIDLKLHDFGDNNGVDLSKYDHYSYMFFCEVYKGDSSPSSKTLVKNIGCIGCYIHDAGTTGIGLQLTALNWSAFNYVYNCPTGIRVEPLFSAVLSNLVVDCNTVGIGVSQSASVVIGNTIYNSASATGSAISLATYQTTGNVILNNIIIGYSGTGGKGINSTYELGLLGYNAFYNNATNESLADVIMDLGNDASLAASPFTNAAGGDFSLAASVVGAIDGAFPGTWYGPASTTDHADIGAVQNGAGAGGGTVNPLRGKLG